MAHEADPQGRWEPLSLNEVHELLAVLDTPWWIAGGYAIELAVGTPLRTHGDVDVLMLRRDQLAVQRALAGWEWWAAEPPGQLRRWEPGEVLPAAVHDIWCRPAPDRPWALQFMLDETEGDQWVSRRDPRIRRPVPEIGRVSPDGLPYLAPEIQLLYKAKGPRPKDLADFESALPILDPDQCRWLRESIKTAYGPGHPWLDRLVSAS